MKASTTRNLVILTALCAFCFLGITPIRAQSSGAAGGCCGQTTTNPATTTSSTQGVSMTCGSGTTLTTTANGQQCVSSH
jgi:hypothetical protein